MAFHTFFQNTFLETDFHDDDLNRIFELEAQFLNNAKAVFFESEWGLKKACDAYSLEGHNFFVTSNGGVLTPPAEDNWDGNSLKLITIAKNFYQKGGDIVFDAFRILKPKYPKLEWHIIGGKPNVTTEGIEGIHYEGFLRPTIATELDRFTSLLKNAFLLIHPTREDSNPLVLIEAAYFGCPSISVRDFAIPELVVDGKTGFLLDRPISATEVAESIERVILSPTYHQLRAETRRYSTSKFSWSNSGQFIAQKILEACTDVSTRVAK
jgi:glycosyltransferase involved in cell wall biosynthesis